MPRACYRPPADARGSVRHSTFDIRYSTFACCLFPIPDPRSPRSFRRPARATAGFTFVELLVVMLIIAAMTAVAVPLFSGSFRSTTLRAAANNLTAKLSHAHRQSIIKSKAVRVAFDTSVNTSWLEFQNEHGDFEFEQSSLNTKRKLPEHTSFLRITGPGTESGGSMLYATFFPDGTAESRDIIIQSEDKDVYEITIHPATGAVAVKKI